MKVKSIVLVIAMLLPLSPALATTTYSEERVCPICSNKVMGRSVGSTSMGGCDLDLCPRYLGASVICIIPMTCSHCLYSGYLSDFPETDKKDKEALIHENIKRAILEEKVLKPLCKIEKGTRSSRIPSFVRQDLIVQTKRLMGKNSSVIGLTAMLGSWIVRHNVNLAACLSRKVNEEYRVWSSALFRHPKAPGLRGVMRVRMAVLYLLIGRMLNTKRDRAMGALGAIITAGIAGEYFLAKALLPELSSYLSTESLKTLSKKIDECQKMEAHFQRQALTELEKVDLEGLQDPMQRFETTYRILELHRRLGDGKVARSITNVEVFVKGLKRKPPFLLLLVNMSTSLSRACCQKGRKDLVKAYEKALIRVAHPKKNLKNLEKVAERILKVNTVIPK